MAGVKTKSLDATKKHNAPRLGRRIQIRSCGICSARIEKPAESTTLLRISYEGGRSKQRVPAHRKCVGAEGGKR